MSPSVRRAERIVAGSFGVGAVCALGFAVVYWTTGSTQLEGVLLAIAFAALAVGLVVWADRLLPDSVAVQLRHRLASPEPVREAVDEALEERQGIGRRKLLAGTLAGAGGALLVALASPLRSLGTGSKGALSRTPWAPGVRVVTSDGSLVHLDQLPVGGLVTAFPEGSPGSADGQIVLVRVHPEDLRLPAGRESWAPQGCVAYSKVCTHAGCPVGLYEDERHELLCPCHQSAFDVLRGAVPTAGPAAAPLPQLPLTLNADGTFSALGDFPEPIGPAYWRRS
jgi:ubiquinol-cytochrome c reductase iron-sulfur subunit